MLRLQQNIKSLLSIEDQICKIGVNCIVINFMTGGDNAALQKELDLTPSFQNIIKIVSSWITVIDNSLAGKTVRKCNY